MNMISLLLILATCWHLTNTVHIGSNDLRDYESMFSAVDYVSLSTLKKTIYFMETKLIWMIGHHRHQWSYARRSLVSAMHERIRTLSHIPISIDLPDSCTFRAIHFDVRSDYPTMTFAFSSRRRNGPSFIFRMPTDQVQMARVLKTRKTPQYLYSSYIPQGSSVNGTLLLMAHPNGLGIQIIMEDIELLSTSKVLKFGKAPVDIAIYQNQSVSAVTDMYCLSPKEFCLQYPSRRGAWTEIQVKMMGKSVFPVTALNERVVNHGPGMTDAIPLQKRRKSENPLEPKSFSSRGVGARRRRRDSGAVHGDIGNIDFSKMESHVSQELAHGNSLAAPSYFGSWRKEVMDNSNVSNRDAAFVRKVTG